MILKISKYSQKSISQNLIHCKLCFVFRRDGLLFSSKGGKMMSGDKKENIICTENKKKII
jgi:hypothetical protein